MELITHANALPWQIDASFLIQLMELAALAVVAAALFGLLYATLHRLLSSHRHSAGSASDTAGWERTTRQEGIYDET